MSAHEKLEVRSRAELLQEEACLERIQAREGGSLERPSMGSAGVVAVDAPELEKGLACKALESCGRLWKPCPPLASPPALVGQNY